MDLNALAAETVQDEEVDKLIADFGNWLQDDQRCVLKGALTIFANVYTDVYPPDDIVRSFIDCAILITEQYVARELPPDCDDTNPDCNYRHLRDLKGVPPM